MPVLRDIINAPAAIAAVWAAWSAPPVARTLILDAWAVGGWVRVAAPAPAPPPPPPWLIEAIVLMVMVIVMVIVTAVLLPVIYR